MKLIDVSVPLDAQPADLPGQHAVHARTDQADRARRQLERLDAAHERACRHPRRRAAPFLRRRASASTRCRSRSCCGRTRVIEVTSRKASTAEDLAGVDLSEDVRVLHQDAQLPALGVARVPHGLRRRHRKRARNTSSSTASRSSASTTSRSSSTRRRARRRTTSLLGAGTIVIEGLNLRDVEPGVYEMFCLPLRVVGSDGAPARVVLRRS